jgi:hypothetical protein
MKSTSPLIRAMISLTLLLISVSSLSGFQGYKSKKMPQEELEGLMTDSIAQAKRMLAEYGEFYPYGGAIDKKGKVISIEVDDGDEHPPSQKLIDRLVGSFQSQATAGEYRATAIVYDVRVIPPGSTEKTDAICLELDHVEGVSLKVFVPYKIKRKNEVIYGEMFSRDGAARIFKKQ